MLYGYKIENGEVIIDEESADIVRRIFNDRINGVTGPKIGAALYAEKILHFSDSEKKSGDKVMSILRNERYFGEYGYPPIVSKETFQQARDSMCRKVFGKPLPAHKIIKGMSFCTICGKHMGHNYNGTGVAKWHCCTKGCVNFMPVITEEEYLSAICSILNSVIKSPKLLNVKSVLTEYVPSDSIKEHEGNLNAMLSAETIEAEKILSEIFALATEQYACCTYDLTPYITAELKATAKRYEPSDMVNTELLQQIADRIVVSANKKISVIFKNGKKITYKESDTDEP